MGKEPSEEKKQESLNAGIDLSSLGDLALGPSWSDPDKAGSKENKYRNYEERPRRGGGGGPRRDRRGRPPRGGEGRGSGSEDAGGDNRQGGGGGGRDRRGRDFRRSREQQRPFDPTVEVSFYPEDAPFKALTNAVRSSCRTFELFEIARLILDKPDRFVVVVRPQDKTRSDLFISKPDGVPFESEEEALAHVFNNHIEQFFEVEEVEAEPPKGSFQVIHKCGVTGELLSPPNYHRYQALLQEHYAARIGSMSFERFQSKIESVRDEEAINSWLDKMKTRTRYKLKGAPEGQEAPEFDNLESARFYILSNRKEEVVEATRSARFGGKMLETLPPRSNIRRSVESVLEQQKRFPLDTANHLRGRLRRLNFAVYKKGSKGVSYVCAVKRRFRRPGQVFAENLQELIDFIEAHPNIQASQLPQEFLGIKADASPDAKAPAEGASEESEAAATPAPEKEPESPELAQLRRDLRWLVSEGYVIEYSDGKLFAPPPREDGPRAKKGEKKPDEGKKSEEAKAAPAAEPAVAPEKVEPASDAQEKQMKAEAEEAAQQAAPAPDAPTVETPATEAPTQPEEPVAEAEKEADAQPQASAPAEPDVEISGEKPTAPAGRLAEEEPVKPAETPDSEPSTKEEEEKQASSKDS